MSPRYLLLFGLFFFAACSASREAKSPAPPPVFSERPKNIILLIGDGMSVAQVSAGLYWSGVGKSVFERFPIVGFHKSYSHNDLITDSAAGATAFACGEKADNNAVGVLPPDNQPCQTILEDLDARGWATGMLVTCSATHATPAAFIAHVDIRAFTEKIALSYLQTSLDCFVGGGEDAFNARPDRRNLEDSLKQRGYVIRRSASFKRLPLDGSRPFMVFTAGYEPGTASAGRHYLPDATRIAPPFLSLRSEKGFFLMVEGSQIDWACHANDKNWLRAEQLDFEATVRAALDFAATDGQTLVLVTGDHECGGLSLNAESGNRRVFAPAFSERLHTGVLVPVFAYGPQAELFSGIYENTALHEKMYEALGLKE